VIVIDPLEAGEQHFALVDRRIEAPVPIDVGIDDEIGRLRDDHLVVDDGDAERRDERRLLHERMRLVGPAIVIGVLEHDDAVAVGLAGMVAAIADALGDPDAAIAVDVDVGRVVEERRRGPQGHLESVRHLEDVERDANGLAHRSLGRLGRRGRRRLLRRRRERLLRSAGAEDQREHHRYSKNASSRHLCPPLSERSCATTLDQTCAGRKASWKSIALEDEPYTLIGFARAARIAPTPLRRRFDPFHRA
jgi:hypothetical protein